MHFASPSSIQVEPTNSSTSSSGVNVRLPPAVILNVHKSSCFSRLFVLMFYPHAYGAWLHFCSLDRSSAAARYSYIEWSRAALLLREHATSRLSVQRSNFIIPVYFQPKVIRQKLPSRLRRYPKAILLAPKFDEDGIAKWN